MSKIIYKQHIFSIHTWEKDEDLQDRCLSIDIWISKNNKWILAYDKADGRDVKYNYTAAGEETIKSIPKKVMFLYNCLKSNL